MESESLLPALADTFLLPPMDLRSLHRLLIQAKHQTFTLWLRTGECLPGCYLLGDTTTWGWDGRPERIVLRIKGPADEMHVDGARVADAVIPDAAIVEAANA